MSEEEDEQCQSSNTCWICENALTMAVLLIGVVISSID